MTAEKVYKKIFRKFLRVVLWIVISLTALLIAIALLIQVPYVQSKIKAKALSFIQSKINTKVTLGQIALRFPKELVIRDLYVEDQATDTLLFVGELGVDTDMWDLLHNRITLDHVLLENTTANINRKKSTGQFNFDYIISAFAGDTTVVDTTDTKPWKFAIGVVEINNTRLSFDDETGGTDARLHIGSFEADVDAFDLDSATIDVDDITLTETNGSLTQRAIAPVNAAPSAAPATDTPSWKFGLNSLDLRAITFQYIAEEAGQRINLRLTEAGVKIDKFDLPNREIAIRDISMEKTFVAYQQTIVPGASRKNVSDSLVADTTASENWKISLDEISLVENSLQYHDFNKPVTPTGVDFNHLWLSRFNLQAEDLSMDGMKMKGKIDELTFSDRSGFSVRTFQTTFLVDDQHAAIDNFVFESGDTHVALQGKAQFASLKTIGETYPDATIDFVLRPSYVSMKDLLLFSPALPDSLPVRLTDAGRIGLSASVTGKVKDLTIGHVGITIGKETYLNAHGKVVGLPDMQRAAMTVSLDKFYTTHDDVHQFVEPWAIPSAIAIPAWLNLNGSFSGSLEKPVVNATLTSSIGSVLFQGKANLDSIRHVPDYTASMRVVKLNLGKLLKQDTTMGVINMTASVTGQGLRAEQLNTRVDARVADFTYNRYTYRDFNIHGTIKKYFFEGRAWLKDKNLDFALEGDMDYKSGGASQYKFDFNLNNADFKALNLAIRPLRARGSIHVDLATADFKAINGSLAIRKVAIYNGEALYSVDSLLFASIDQRGQTDIRIDSDLLAGSFNGTINLFSLPEVLRRFVDNYFSLQDAAYKKPADPQHFKFNLVLKKTELITDILIPELKSFEPGPIRGEFNSQNDDLSVFIGMGKIQYANVSTDSLLISINSDKKSLYYNLVLDNIRYDSFQIEAVRLDGTISSDSIRNNLIFLDSLHEDRFRIGGIIYSLKQDFQFSFLPEQLILNYDHWKIPADNFIRFGGKGIVTNNIVMSNGEQQLLLETKQDKDSTMHIGFRSLDLQTLAAIITTDKKLLEGKLAGDLNLIQSRNAFNANLQIADLNIMQQPWGNVSFTVDRATADRFDMDLSVDGGGIALAVKGNYVSAATGALLDLQADLKSLDLAIIEPLTGNQLSGMKGNATGSFKVKGTVQDPDINGEFTFDKAQFTSTYVKSAFTLEDETITFNGKGIRLNNFEIRDADNHTATISGDVSTEDFSDFDLRLSVVTKDFRILNTTEKDNELFYGNIQVNAKARIRGSSNQPNIDVTVGLSDGSSLTYIVPQSEKGVLDQKGIVKFVDKDAKNDPFLSSIKPQDTIQSQFKGFNLTANIELNDKETFNIIVDAATGDKLSIKGNTTLTLVMDPTGNMDLSGRYEISSGSYDFSFYKLLKRNFEIEKGSTITWSGDPLNGVMDIRALFKVETSPLELMSAQASETEATQYRQRLPFLVYLNIKGELLFPDISFSLDMPLERRNVFAGSVYAKLQDINTRESDLNKQVFALLVLKRFIAENPFDSEGSFAGSARGSVSRLLSEQLNRLSENVKGVQLNFDVKSYEDYSTGQAAGQTQLQLGVSKNLFNDRLVVKLSGNVNIEGETSTQDSFTDYIGDLALEYKITDDGRLRITGFRNSDYDMIDGELTKTGAGLIYIKDYNTLKELFRANEKQN